MPIENDSARLNLDFSLPRENFMLGKIVKKAAGRLGYTVTRKTTADPQAPVDFDESTIELFDEIKPFTMTSLERVNALVQSVEYIVKHEIPGDIVECGVWRGGSMMAVARTLRRLNRTRFLHLYDTFEGMSEPTEKDTDFRGELAASQLEADDTKTSNVWAYSPIDDVKKNLSSVDYDTSQVKFIKGKVEDTIPDQVPENISLLRLDTDWYESTYHELVHLYPRLSVGGVLIIDDYGHWQGARKAVDQYIEENNLRLLLSRIDYTGRMCVKLD